MLLVLPVDPSIGRVDQSSLSQQTLMELFTEGITNRERLSGHLESNDITEWNSLTFDDNGDAIALQTDSAQLHGTINLEWLPLKIEIVRLGNNYLNGTLDLENLPDSLLQLYLFRNQFVGSVSLTNLPERMNWLSLYDNDLEGTIDLTRLPMTLTNLYLGINGFEGKTDFSKLPDSLRVLSIGRTRLSGDIAVKENLEVRAIHTKVTFIE